MVLFGFDVENRTERTSTSIGITKQFFKVFFDVQGDVFLLLRKACSNVASVPLFSSCCSVHNKKKIVPVGTVAKQQKIKRELQFLPCISVYIPKKASLDSSFNKTESGNLKIVFEDTKKEVVLSSLPQSISYHKCFHPLFFLLVVEFQLQVEVRHIFAPLFTTSNALVGI